MLLKSISIILCLYTSVHISQAADGYSRLPRNVQPIHYTLDVTPYFDEKHSENKNFTFDGYTSIMFKVLEYTNSVTFHYCNLTIDQNSLEVIESTTNKSIKVINHVKNVKEKTYTVFFDEPLLNDEVYTICINYSANLTDSLTGFYRSHYVNKHNHTQWMAVTYFEEIHAREAFPCFDEPAMKATFDIRIRRLPNYISISNMPKKKSIENCDADGRVLDIFETTKKMSTYLVCFIVTDYKCVSNKFKNHSIYVMEDMIENVEHNLEVAEDLVSALEQYVLLEYPLPKLDHIVVPQFFPSGMENWGLITYSMNSFMYNPQNNKNGEMNQAFLTMSHEIAHQWFGNLVTCEWWTQLWLNEGFATYMQYRALELVKPNWRVDDQFAIKSVMSALAIDSSEAPALETDVSELIIDAATITVLYSKASAVIRMLEHVLTPPIFRTGIINYIAEMSGGSVNDDDLWRYLQKALDDHKGPRPNLGGLTVVEIAKTWTQKSGYPLVTVEQINSTTLKLAQVVYDENKPKDENFTSDANYSAWWIPINYATEMNSDYSDLTATYWLGKDPIYIESNVSDWILFNKRRTGYYRVFYDTNSWHNIQEVLLKNNELIHPVDRAFLIDDFFNFYVFVRNEYVFNITQYLENEINYTPWEAASNIIVFYYWGLQKNKDILQLYKEYFHRIISKVYENVNGFEEQPSDDHIMKMKRSNILNMACTIQYKNCTDEARGLMNKLYSGEITTISPNLQSIIFCEALRNTKEEMWNFVFNQINKTRDTKQRIDILESLCCADNQTFINVFILYLLNIEENNLSIKEINAGINALYAKARERTNTSMEVFISNVELFQKGLQTKNREIFVQAIEVILGTYISEEIVKIFDDNISNSTEAIKKMLMPVIEKETNKAAENKSKPEPESLKRVRLWLEAEKSRSSSKKILPDDGLINVKANEIDVDLYVDLDVDVELTSY